MSFILTVTNRIGLTDFEHIAIDGTIKNAYNSSFNIIKENEISLLINHYMVKELTKEEIKKLRQTARKFLDDKSKTDEEKIEILFYWWQLSALIPTKQQNRENSGNLPDNPFAIDYFVFDEYKNVFICPHNEELTLDGAYHAPQEKGG